MLPSPRCRDCEHFTLVKMKLGNCARRDRALVHGDRLVTRVNAGSPCPMYDPSEARIVAQGHVKTGYRTVADTVYLMRRHLPVETSWPVLEQGAASALAETGATMLREIPILVNFGVLGRLTLMAQPFRVHELSTAAVRTVEETDLHSLPSQAPLLLRRPFVVQVSDPTTQVLFGATTSMGGYWYEDKYFLVGTDTPDGAWVVRWKPKWSGKDLAAGVLHEEGLHAEMLEEKGQEAVRFLVVLSALLEAVSSPLRSREEGPRLPKRKKGKQQHGREWAVSYVNISGEKGSGHGGGSGGASAGKGLARSVMVRAHLKRQHYGKGNAFERWIYVEKYEARRWFTTRPTKVKVT